MLAACCQLDQTGGQRPPPWPTLPWCRPPPLPSCFKRPPLQFPARCVVATSRSSFPSGVRGAHESRARRVPQPDHRARCGAFHSSLGRCRLCRHHTALSRHSQAGRDVLPLGSFGAFLCISPAPASVVHELQIQGGTERGAAHWLPRRRRLPRLLPCSALVESAGAAACFGAMRAAAAALLLLAVLGSCHASELARWAVLE